jgi:hypothetical protein
LISISAGRIAMVLYALPRLFYYERLVRKYPINDIIRKMAEKSLQQNRLNLPDNGSSHNLITLWKACHFLQNRLFRKQKPCLPRSLLLFDWCMVHGQKAGLVVGVKKMDGRLEGHSWILVDGHPFQENQSFLDTFYIIYDTDTERSLK